MEIVRIYAIRRSLCGTIACVRFIGRRSAAAYAKQCEDEDELGSEIVHLPTFVTLPGRLHAMIES